MTDTVKKRNDKNPYKALDPYAEGDRALFFGREKETHRLFSLVTQEPSRLTVVYGKSGIGKTSLLHAGLFPLLREEHFLPVPIRLKLSPDAGGLMEQVRFALKHALSSIDGGNNRPVTIASQIPELKPEPMLGEETLWEYFRRAKHVLDCGEKKPVPVTPVLVFDQFEEVFTAGKHHAEKEKIFHELSWLIEEHLPPEVKKRVFSNDDRAKRLTYAKVPSTVKVIISLREDFLADLNSLKNLIPSIGRSSYRLLYLVESQAREIISKPAKGFRDEGTIVKILDFFQSKDGGGGGGHLSQGAGREIEPAFLSLLCFQVVEKNMTGHLTRIELNILLLEYYEERMKDYPKKVHKFVESRLLTDKGFRTPYYLDKRDVYVEKLVEDRILRIFYEGERAYVEIVHDLLAPVIRKKQYLRIRNRRRMMLIVAFVIIILIVVYTSIQWSKAENERIKADAQRKKAQVNWLTAESLVELERDNTTALLLVKEAIDRAGHWAPPRSSRVLTRVAYSSYEKPFYIAQYPLALGETIYSSTYSKTGQELLTAHQDGSVRLLDVKGKNNRTLTQHTAMVNSAVLSPDGRFVLSASWDRTARLTSLDGQRSQEFKHNGAVLDACFSPGGNFILTASHDRTARMWDRRGKELLKLQHSGRVFSASFSPDNSFILTASWDKTAKIWDLKGRPIALLDKHEDMLSSAAVSNDSRFILTGSWDNSARLWNHKGEPLEEITHKSMVVDTLFFPDNLGNLHFLTAEREGIIKIWKRGNYKQPVTVINHPGPLGSVSISPNGRLIASASEAGKIIVWTPQGHRRASITKHGKKIRTLAFSPDSRRLFTSAQDEWGFLWNLECGPVVGFEGAHRVARAFFTPGGNSVISIGNDGSLQIWDPMGNLLGTIDKREDIVRALVAPEDNSIITVAGNGIIKKWDSRGKIGETLMEGSAGNRAQFVFSPAGDRMLNTSEFNVFVRDLRGKVTATLEHKVDIGEAWFSPTGETILAVSPQAGKATLWDISGKRLVSFEMESGSRLRFSPRGDHILAVSPVGDIVVWALDGRVVSRDKTELGEKSIASVQLSPKADMVLILLDGEALLVTLGQKEPLKLSRKQGIKSASFSPDGERLLVAFGDRTAEILDLEGRPLAVLEHQSLVDAVFSPGGDRVLTVSSWNPNSAIKVWLTPGAIMRWLEKFELPELPKEYRNNLDLAD